MKFQLVATAFLLAFSALLLFNAIPPNRWFGVRTPRTLASPPAWYRAHRAFGWLFLAVGSMATALTLWPTMPVHPAWGLVGVLAVAAATVLVYRRFAA